MILRSMFQQPTLMVTKYNHRHTERLENKKQTGWGIIMLELEHNCTCINTHSHNQTHMYRHRHTQMHTHTCIHRHKHRHTHTHTHSHWKHWFMDVDCSPAVVLPAGQSTHASCSMPSLYLPRGQGTHVEFFSSVPASQVSVR